MVSASKLHGRLSRAAPLAGALLALLAACSSAGAAPETEVAPAVEAVPEPMEPWEHVATSVEGRPIRVRTLGHGPRKVLWVGGIHGDEREGALATAELPGAFLAAPGAAERVTLVVVEDLNPDGTAHGRRTNARGIDLNRNFPSPSFRASRRHGAEPLSEPESRALFELVTGWQPDLVIVCHSWRGQEFVNFDGPARAEAERFAALSGMELRASDSLSPTPGSFGTWAGIAQGYPVLTLEYRRGRTTESAWELTREAILAVVLGEPGT